MSFAIAAPPNTAVVASMTVLPNGAAGDGEIYFLVTSAGQTDVVASITTFTGYAESQFGDHQDAVQLYGEWEVDVASDLFVRRNDPAGGITIERFDATAHGWRDNRLLP